MFATAIRRFARAALLPAALLAALSHPAAAFDTRARAALMVDMQTGAVLLEKNADDRIPPASMSKLMTLDMVFEALKAGRLSLDDEFRVSARAYQFGGSMMFLREGDRVRISDLLRGVIVQSGNDAAVVLAEGLGGTETAFADRMNERAAEMGMTASHFSNSNGWPDPEQFMSARDLVTLTGRIITDYPDLYQMFAEREFEWEGVNQRNRNPLLGLGLGVDGLKTGHTSEAGFGMVGSAIRDGRRIVFMFGGLDTDRARAEEGERLVDWAFRQFSNETLYTAGQILGVADVWIGAEPQVVLTVAEDVIVTLPVGARPKIDARITWNGPIEAPIASGARIATLTIRAPEAAPIEIPVVAKHAVARGGYLTRLSAAAQLLARDVMGDGGATPEDVDAAPAAQ
ncbi:MAG: D-alanyl-D-alanine carboxypeptidase (penicillin-binding protein 5/6) [Paracoccaceae bacterium]